MSVSARPHIPAPGCGYHRHMDRAQNGNWTPDRRAEKAALRRDYRVTTPGQRVEEAIVLSRELTSLPARCANRV